MIKRPDVVVIGGGVIGLACAWKLAARSLRVTLLDGAAPGASAASLGVLAPSSPRSARSFHRLHRMSLEMFAGFVQELERDSGAAAPYRRCGGLEVILCETQYRQAEDEVQAVVSQRWEWEGLPAMEILSPEEAREREPEVKIGDYGALYTRVTARVLPVEFLQALRRACLASGVDVRNGCSVQSIQIAGGQTTGVHTQEGFLPCGSVVVCAGAWSSQLHTLLGKYCRMKPVRGQALSVEAERTLIRHVIKRGGFYLVPQTGTVIALGSTTERQSGFSSQTTSEGIQEILNGTIGAVSGLEKAAVKKKWAGLRPSSGDGKPYIGPVPEASGLFVASGHYKIGFGYAPVTATIITDLVAEGKTSVDIREVMPRKTEIQAGRG